MSPDNERRPSAPVQYSFLGIMLSRFGPFQIPIPTLSAARSAENVWIVGLTLKDGNAGPYDNIADFNQHLTNMCGLISDAANRAVVADVHSRSHSYRVFFAHADLNPGNVLIHNGRLSGFVDWEFAGWYPEYWDFTKACYIVRIWTLWLGTMKSAFPEYSDELKAEQILRDHTCPF